jgi:hypothetical protein
VIGAAVPPARSTARSRLRSPADLDLQRFIAVTSREPSDV